MDWSLVWDPFLCFSHQKIQIVCKSSQVCNSQEPRRKGLWGGCVQRAAQEFRTISRLSRSQATRCESLRVCSVFTAVVRTSASSLCKLEPISQKLIICIDILREERLLERGSQCIKEWCRLSVCATGQSPRPLHQKCQEKRGPTKACPHIQTSLPFLPWIEETILFENKE